jgi:NADH-quinone oxidoreductase subunit M
MPVFAGLFLIITMGSAGLPALSGFVGEFLTLLGTFVAGDSFPAGYALPAPRLLAVIATSGVIFGAVYLLYMFHKVFFGPLNRAKNGQLRDLSGRELAVLIPLVVGIFVMGLAPGPMLKTMKPSVNKFLTVYANRLAEADGPAHLYGHAPPAKATIAVSGTASGAASGTVSGGAADLQRQLGELAADADKVRQTLDGAHP